MRRSAWWGETMRCKARGAVGRLGMLLLGGGAGVMAMGGIRPSEAQVVYRTFPVAALVASIDGDARMARSGDTLVTLDVRDSTVAYVIKEIARQAHLQPVYNNDVGALVRKRVSVHVTRVSATDAFVAALKGTGLTAKLVPNSETVVIRAQDAARETTHSENDGGSIRGTVTDSATGTPIMGATATLQGTRISATTSSDGGFVLNDVPVGDQAVAVKAFGYKPVQQLVTVTDGTRQSMRVVMRATATILSGVVTTATGLQSKLSVGSDITTINVDSVMQTAPIHSVTDLLENRVPGLTVVHTTGTPGDPSRLLLRGAASVNASNNPIVVVDGVRVYDPDQLGNIQDQFIPPGNSGYGRSLQMAAPRPSPLDQIDPNTIETIEVLKGPSASALYGSDAANGVIIITTKKGQVGHTHWNVIATQGVNYIPGRFPTLTYVFGHQSGRTGEWQCVVGVLPITGNPPCIVDSVRAFQLLDHSRFSPLTSGLQSNASATISGGASALTYSFTGSASNSHGETRLPDFVAEQYTEAVGSAPPTWMRHPDDYVNWSGSGQIQATLSPQATLTVSDMLSSSTQHRTDLGLSAVGDLIDTYVDTTTIANSQVLTSFFTQITQATLTSTTTAILNWRVQPWLPLTIQGGYNRNQESDKQYLPSGLPASILPVQSVTSGDTTGYYDLGTQQATVATLNVNTTIPIAFGRGPALQLALGTNFVSQSQAAQDISTTLVPVGVSDPTSFPQTEATLAQQLTQSSATYGWFLEPQLQLHSRIFVTPGIRLDGGTASGGGAGFTVFPKTSVSYIAIDQTGQLSGTRWTQVLSLLRLRGTFGLAGVQPLPGQALRLFSAPAVISLDGGSASATGTAITNLGNTLLHPERSRELELGIDAQIFQNRASLTATYYDKDRIDAIEQVPVSPSIYGFSTVETAFTTYANVGVIRNTGVEVTGDIRVLDRSTVTWDVNGFISTNTNRVLSTTGGVSGATCNTGVATKYVGLSGFCIKAGYPLGAEFAKVIVGYGDQNHDGIIEPNEVFLSDSGVFIGGPDPRYTASFGTTVALWHGRLSLAVNGSYQNGMAVSNTISQIVLTSLANQPGSTVLEQVEGLASRTSGSGAVNSIVSVNALRLDGLSANVTLPSVVARVFRSQQATLALQGRNLGMWTNYLGPDPNATAGLNGFMTGDIGGLPSPRTWQLTLRIAQ